LAIGDNAIHPDLPFGSAPEFNDAPTPP